MLPRIPSPAFWALLLFLGVCNLLIISKSDTFLIIDNGALFTVLALALFFLYIIGLVYRTIRPNRIISTITESLLFFFLTCFFCGICTYLTASFALPLNDRLLANIDAAMGFDWLEFLTFVNSHTWLAESLTFFYHILGIQLLAVMAILSITGRQARLNEFLGLFLVGAVATVVLAAIFPSAGAYAFHNPDPSLFAHRSAEAGMWHYPDLMSLRDGSMKGIKIMSLEGIVTFPSFHTAAALIAAWALRDIRWLCALMSVVSLLVVISTLSEGGHHLIDVVTGSVIVVVAAYLLNRPFNARMPIARLNEEHVNSVAS